MKTKFLLCMRPSVIETEDVKPSPPLTTSSYAMSSGGCRIFRQRAKRVAPEKYIRQLSLKSNACTSEGKSEKAANIPRSVSEACIHTNYSDEEPVCLKKATNVISNDKVNGGPESNLGAYLLVSCLLFTIFLGKFFGIMCMLILLVGSFYPRRKNDSHDGRRSDNVVVKSPEKGSVKEYNKRVIMDGLLERKIHYRENNKIFI
ncbi:hypothetical protein HanRHA438_Chr15g0705561 [Helianthus annuus]|nr:hypothetical protein HanIR_Chr15g0753401 [Helianthus annuus]KAJ0844714.1 hypothetical protein HanRHA438_Chr15g0705561 [Helianthus annuus]